MGKHQTSPSSDRREWQRIFGTLVEMLQSQQSQIETLANDRKFLEEYIHIQHDRWISRVRFLESYISQMKKEEVKSRRIQAAKLDLVVVLKQREALCYKKQFELAECDLEDFCSCMETLSGELLKLKGTLKSGVGDSKTEDNLKEDEWCTKALQGEIRELKHAYKKLSSKKEAEVSALLAEKDFVWNQFKKMEGDYIGILKSKKIEVEHANEAAEKLRLNLENLQTSIKERDEIITKLEAEHADTEMYKRRHIQETEETIKLLRLNIEELSSLAKEKDETIAKLRNDLANMGKSFSVKSRSSKDLDSQKKSRNAQITPAASYPRDGSRRRKLENTKNNAARKRRSVEVFTGSQSSTAIHGLERCSSKQRNRTISPVERPALFHSNFKVPKLKNSPVAVQ